MGVGVLHLAALKWGKGRVGMSRVLMGGAFDWGTQSWYHSSAPAPSWSQVVWCYPAPQGVGLKYRGIWELALRAACVCWRWKKHVLIRLRSWEVTRFIKLRGAPISGNTSVLRLWWGTSQVTKHCTSRNAEACSREVHKPQPGGSLVGLPPSPPFPCLFPISSNLSLHFGCPSPSELCATTTPSACSPGFASSSKPLQLKISLKALAMQLY